MKVFVIIVIFWISLIFSLITWPQVIGSLQNIKVRGVMPSMITIIINAALMYGAFWLVNEFIPYTILWLIIAYIISFIVTISKGKIEYEGKPSKRYLEKELIDEIKMYAHVKDFPLEDGKIISEFISKYENGFPSLYALTALNTLDKYPELSRNWDSLMIKYKKLGLFPKWNFDISEEEQ